MRGVVRAERVLFLIELLPLVFNALSVLFDKPLEINKMQSHSW